MSEHQLEVILKMRDEASKKIEQFSQKVENEMNKAGDSFIAFGRQISKVGKDLATIGLSITGPLALAFKTTADNSLEAHEAMKRMGDAGRELQVAIGTSLIPVVEKISYLFAGLTQWFESLDPKMRDMALQFALIAGLCFTLGGALLHVIGKMSDLIGRTLQFAAAHPVLLLIAAALTLIILNWEKVRQVAIPVMNALEIGINMVAIGFQGFVQVIADALAGITGGLEKVLYYLSMIPGPQQKLFESMRGGAKATQEFFEQVSSAAKQTINDLEASMASIMETGKGDISSFTDDAIGKINELYSFLSNPPKVDISTSDIDAQSVIVKEQQKVDQMRTIWQAWNNEKTAGDMARLQTETEYYQLAIDAQTKAHVSMWTVVGQMKDQFATGMTQMFMQMMQGTLDAKKFFQDLGWKMVEILINFAVQKAINWAISQAMLAAEITASYGAAAAIAAAWAPAAAMASLASFGGNSGPAMGGIAATTAFAYMMAIPALEKGGDILSPGRVMVGERGPELLDLPRGARVSPLGQGGSASSITIHFHGAVVREEMDFNRISEEISRRIARGTSR